MVRDLSSTSPAWLVPVFKSVRAAVALFSHLILGALLIGGIHLFHMWLQLLGDAELWNAIHISWFIDTLDCGVLVLFVFWGLIDANKALKGEESE